MFGGGEPDFVPISTLGETARDDVDHVFSRVGVFGTWCVVAGEVFFDRFTIIADVTEIDCLSAFGEEKEGIELSE